MEKLFKLKQNNTTVRAEVLAGVTTFVAMCYILFVNPGMFQALGLDEAAQTQMYNGVYVATALSAVVGTILIGLLANLPLAQASGMGLNAFFVYTVCFSLGFTYANALVFVLVDGLIFVLLTVTGLRGLIFNAIPKTVKTAIPAGIGLFIAFIGLQDAGIIVPSTSTCVDLVSMNLLGNATWASVMPIIITIFTLILIFALSKRGMKGAVLVGIITGAVVYYALGFTVPDFYATFSLGSMNPLTAFKDFADVSIGKVFTEGFDFSAYLETHSMSSLILNFATTALAFCMVDMFDTMGTLFGACKCGNMLVKDKNGEDTVPNMDKAMLADAIATCTGAVCGTSTVTTFVESSAGVAAGGRTGLAAMVTGGLFLVATFLSPITKLVPACAYAAALIYVGVLMLGGIGDIDWKNPSIALPSFMTIAIMPFSYNISYGIAFGLMSYIAIKLLTDRVKKISITTWVISLLFIAMFFLTH